MKKIILMSTVSYSIEVLIKNQPRFLSQYFDEVELIGADSGDILKIIEREKVKFFPIEMERKITPFKDLKTVSQLIKHFRKEKPNIVYTFTPKAGLLGMIAAFFAMVPTRIHNVVGMPLMEARGLKRVILTVTEKLTYFFATHVYCNSFGLKEYIEKNLTKKNVKVIKEGSINGVDIEFYKDNFTTLEKQEIREQLNFNSDDFIVSFMGRIVKDKGVNELVDSFKVLTKKYKNIKLLIVGKFEQELNPIEEENFLFIQNNPNIKVIDFQNDLRKYLTVTDLFVLPSYREGLPNSLIEAGSYGLPLIATDINGCNEIISHKENGLLIEPKSSESLCDAIEELYLNKTLYEEIKSNVRNMIVKRYEQQQFLRELKDCLFKDGNLN
ncbi:glycosyltransferase family 4 protein [Arcobacter sp.]|uniref:glycosyltransferase family 4 protein n=1 Tax=Arcobacter sp. TaxID=1872629 RepID=UPI003D0A30C6